MSKPSGWHANWNFSSRPVAWYDVFYYTPIYDSFYNITEYEISGKERDISPIVIQAAITGYLSQGLQAVDLLTVMRIYCLYLQALHI